MLRSMLVVAIAWFGGSILAAPPAPVASTPVSFELANPTLESAAAELGKQAGIPIVVPAALKATPVTANHKGSFWGVVNRLATEAKCRLRVINGKVQFLPLVQGSLPTPSSIDGAFLTTVRQVIAKRDFESASGITEVHLEIAWEPRFPVYLIDAEAKILKATGERGEYKFDPSSGRVSASGYVHPMIVRLKGIPREEKALSVLSGSFNVIAAEKLLAVEFKDLTIAQPAIQTVEGVKVSLKPLKTANGQIEVTFDLEYPPSHPEFESFQGWAASNKLRLYDAAGKAMGEPADYNTTENGRRISASYFFPAPKGEANWKGWRAVYETPCPMVQQEVRFELKDILLP